MKTINQKMNEVNRIDEEARQWKPIHDAIATIITTLAVVTVAALALAWIVS